MPSQPAAKTIRSAIRERDFRQQVVDYARLRGWLAAWTWNSIHSPAGWPDVVLCRPPWDQATVTVPLAEFQSGQWRRTLAYLDGHPRLIVAELKVGKSQPTVEQCMWLEALAMAGIPAYLWTPDDWAEIEDVLGR